VVLRSGSSLRELESVAFIEFDHRQQAEILIGEIFISQLPLSSFLASNNQRELMAHYYLYLFELINDQSFFERGDLSPEEFESILQSRYAEYYELVEKSSFYTQSVAKAISSHISKDNVGLLPLGLTSVLNDSLKSVSTLLGGVLVRNSS